MAWIRSIVRDTSQIKTVMPMIDWLAKYRFISEISSSESGLYNLDRTPYVKGIIAALDDPSIEEIYVEKGCQLGLTEVAISRVGYRIAEKPCTGILYILPTLDQAKKVSLQRISPMILETPVIAEKMQSEITRKKVNNLLTKNFKGGLLTILCSNSSSSLRSLPAAEILMDEVDEYPDNLNNQGDILEICRGRQNAQRFKKIFVLSTPTIEEKSKIDLLFKSGDQRRYHVPCPNCNAYNYFKIEDFIWQKGRPETVSWKCPACHNSVTEKYKQKMMVAGKWVADFPEKSGRIQSYHLPAWYSPVGWLSWQSIIEKYEAINNSIEKEKAFKNLILGEVWSPVIGEAPDFRKLYTRRENYQRNVVPKGGYYVLVAAVDFQGDRVEVEIIAFGPGNYQTASIDYRVYYGNSGSNQDPIYNKLERLLDEEFPVEGEKYTLKISGMALDTGFNTQAIYTWARKFMKTKKVFPVKGVVSDTPIGTPKLMDIHRNGQRIRNGVRVWPIGVSLLKSELYSWLMQPKHENGELPPGWCRFPNYDEAYFRMLTAESLVAEEDKKTGKFKYRWVLKTNERRNEALDIRVYARAAYSIAGFDQWKAKDWENLKKQLKNSVAEVKGPPHKSKDQKSFWGEEHKSVWSSK